MKRHVPVKYRGTYNKTQTGQASPRAAIKAFCLECVCWQPKEVTDCTDTGCPLWRYRPFQKSPAMDEGTIAAS